MATYDVVVVGAGPTGLMMGCWLARYGIKPLIVDHKDGPSRETRALGVQARTMETYDMLGLGEKALGEGIPATGASMWSHRRFIAKAQFKDMGEGVSPHPYMFIMGQDRTERMLYEDLQAHGGDVAWNTGLAELTQDAGGVDLVLEKADGSREEVRARYVMGCDGAGSPVRKALGVGFPGGTYDQRAYVADVTAEGPMTEGELNLCIDQGRFQAFFPMPGPHHFRIVGALPPDVAAREHVTFEDIREEVEYHSQMAVTSVTWFSTYNVHHRVAETFRRGRVFLLGDAGHIHSPVGGQGMNTGLMDASNLAWKLAAVLNDEMDTRVLETYEAERMPFAKLLVSTTDRVFQLVASGNDFISNVRGLLVPLLFGTATHLSFVRHEVFGIVSQTRIKYDQSLLSRGQAGEVKGGDRLPWVKYADGTSNYDVLTGLVPHIQVYGDVPAGIEAYAASHPRFALKRLPMSDEAKDKGLEAGAFYFIRPDGYVAYAASTLDPADFTRYLTDAWGLEVSASVG